MTDLASAHIASAYLSDLKANYSLWLVVVLQMIQACAWPQLALPGILPEVNS